MGAIEIGAKKQTNEVHPERFAQPANKEKTASVTSNITLNFATLDYEICQSPFEYFTSDQKLTSELEELKSVFINEFHEVRGENFTDNFEWNIGRLDSDLSKKRYSPLYVEFVGVDRNKFLMREEKFNSEWEGKFSEIVSKNKKVSEYENFKEHKQNLMQMDWIYYRTFVCFAYNSKNRERKKFESIISEETAIEYQIFMKRKFEQKIMKEDYKIEKLVEYLRVQSIDFLFLQSINKKVIEMIEKKIEKFRVAATSEHITTSAILISWEAIKKIRGEQQWKSLVAYNLAFINAPPSDNDEPVNRQPKQSTQLMEEQQSSESKINPINEMKALNQSPMMLAEQWIQAQKRQHKLSDLIPKLNWNENTYVQFLDPMVLISADLKPKADQQNHNAQQIVREMQATLCDLQKCCPNCIIVMGMAGNCNWRKQSAFDQFPNQNNKPSTVYKKKTIFQSNLAHAEKLYNPSKDYLITNKPMKFPQVVDISHRNVSKTPYLIPNQAHPYDHFLIQAKLKVEIIRKVC